MLNVDLTPSAGWKITRRCVNASKGTWAPRPAADQSVPTAGIAPATGPVSGKRIQDIIIVREADL